MRFFQPTPTQYVPQYTPLNLELMKQTLDAREMQDLKAEDALAEAANSLVVKGGMYTKPEEVEEVNNYLQSNINNVAQKLHAGEIDAKDAVLNINRLKTFYNTHPSVQFFKEDENLTNVTRTAMTQGKLNNAISPGATYFDNQLKINRPISWKEGKESLANAYNFKTPTSIDAEQNYGKRYADIKPSSLIQEYANQNGFTFQRDSATGLPLVIDKKTGTVNEQVTWQMLYDAGLTMAPDELKNSATDYVQYQKARYKNYTPKQFAIEFANAGAAKIFTKTGITDETKYDVLETMYKAEQEAAAAQAMNQDFEAPTSNIIPTDEEWGIRQGRFFDSLFGSSDNLPRDLNINDLDNPNSITGLKINGVATLDDRAKYTDKHGFINNTNIKYSVIQPYDLPETEKKYFENWLKNNKKHGYMYDNYIVNNPNKVDINPKKLAGIYKDFFNDMKEYTQDIVKTASTASQVNYYSDASINDDLKRGQYGEARYKQQAQRVWTTYVGNKSTGTISDVLINAANNKSRIWSVKDKKFLKQEDIKTINDNYGTTNVPSLGRTNPENLFNVLTGDETFKNGITFSTPDGKQYLIEDRTYGVGDNKAEPFVTELYRKGKMALGQPVKTNWDNDNDIIYKIDKDNQVILLDKTGTKDIGVFKNIADMSYQLVQKNNPFVKEALVPKKTKSTTGKK
jgi:hypothetical protein